MDISIQSQCHLQPFYHRSESLINLPSINNKKQIKRPRRFSIYNFTRKKLTKLPDLNSQQMLQLNPNYSRRYSERLSSNRKNHPFVVHTNTVNDFNRRHHLHYITCRRDKKKDKSSFIYNPSAHSSSTTTTSNLTRSTINITGSESSIFMDQNKLLKPIANDTERSNHFSRK